MKTNHKLPRISRLLPATLCLALCCACTQDPENPATVQGIGDITFANYPRVDGSTSCRHLHVIVGCKLLNIPYTWLPPLVNEWTVVPRQEDIPKGYETFFHEHLKTSQTHGAFMNLIDGNTDMILTHRTLSPDEKAHADATGVTLTETPVALDAFVFVVNKNKPVESLTVQQIRDIYTKRITNWQQAGGRNADMQVYTRPRNSGSEEVMRELVMGGEEPADFPESEVGAMIHVFHEILYNEDAICYTFNNYKELIARRPDSDVSKIAVNGVFPSDETVSNGTYPFIAKVYVAIRSDLDKKSMAYRLYEWLQTADAHTAFTESGYIPIKK